MAQQNILRHLEETFGKIPIFVRENTKYLQYDEEKNHFSCLPCSKIIKISDTTDQTTSNFNKHLESNSHRKYTISKTELENRLKQTFYGVIPPIVDMNIDKLGLNGDKYECVICDKILSVSGDILITKNNFSYHLLSAGHEEKLLEYYDVIKELFNVFGGISATISNHSRFLSRNGKHYLCMICNKQLMVHPTDVEETEKCFEKHLHSLKHIRNAKQSKAFSILPELKSIFSELPNYMLRSIEYVDINGQHFFCSLCNENIKLNKKDTNESKLNFKLHMLTSLHEERLKKRKDPENEVVNRLCDLFEDLSETVQDNIKHLTIEEENFYCEVCAESILIYDDNDNTKASLETHFESFNHNNEVTLKETSCSEALEDLTELFSTIPKLIQSNLKHISYRSGNDFECNLCNKTLKAKFNGDYEDNTYTTEFNFEQHLNSYGHNDTVEKEDDLSSVMMNNLKETLGPLPQYIINNIEHISFDNETLNYCCYLCDKQISIVPGSKIIELTKQNFQNHMLSVGHMAKLKHEANTIMETTEKLESIFGKIPSFILANIFYIALEENFYYCSLCDAKIMRGEPHNTEEEFRKHLFGSNHWSNLGDVENENNEACQKLDFMFWRVPEFILRNIDFLDTIDDDLYCILCQELLEINEDDLDQTKRSLRCHIESERHQSAFQNL